jgi:hypothetical protein
MIDIIIQTIFVGCLIALIYLGIKLVISFIKK